MVKDELQEQLADLESRHSAMISARDLTIRDLKLRLDSVCAAHDSLELELSCARQGIVWSRRVAERDGLLAELRPVACGDQKLDSARLLGLLCRATVELALAADELQPVDCRGCGKTINLSENMRIADGCPCNSARGVNHGLVPHDVCTCVECDPAQTGASRVREKSKYLLALNMIASVRARLGRTT